MARCRRRRDPPVLRPAATVARLAHAAEAGETLRVDLAAGTVTEPGLAPAPFTLDASRRRALLLGLDEIGQTLQQEAAISAWQTDDAAARPWMWAEGCAHARPGVQA